MEWGNQNHNQQCLISLLALAVLCSVVSTVQYVSLFAAVVTNGTDTSSTTSIGSINVRTNKTEQKDTTSSVKSSLLETDIRHAFRHPDTNITNPSSDRPVFALHVGPPKTATTYLQYGLTDYRDVLKKDNYVYLGQIMDDPQDMWDHHHGPMLNILKDLKCTRSANRARVQGQEHAPSPCWKQLERMLHAATPLEARRITARVGRRTGNKERRYAKHGTYQY